MRMLEEPDHPERLHRAASHGGEQGGQAVPAHVAAALGAAGRLTPAAVLALQRSAGNAAVVAMLQRQADADRQTAATDPGAQCRQVLSTSGSPMPDALRTEMEARLGADFSDVRLHTDTVAQRSAQGVHARAYTSRNHVVIGAGGGDRHTLAHELTHVIQQRQGPVAGTDTGTGLRVSDPSDVFERAAEANARRVLAGPVPVRRETGCDSGAPPSPDATGQAGPAPVQRTFMMANKVYNSGNVHEIDEEKVFAKASAAQRRYDAKTHGHIVERIRAMADGEEDYGRFANYENLINAALTHHRAQEAKNLPQVTSMTIRTSAFATSSSAASSSAASSTSASGSYSFSSSSSSASSSSGSGGGQLTDQEKVERLAQVRRTASLAVPETLHDFRDRSRMVTSFVPLASDHEGQNPTYTIGHTGNWLLGGAGAGHSYRELAKNAKIHSGLTDVDLAKRFIAYLGGDAKAFAGMNASAISQCLKMVSLFQGPEFRRAAFNSVAAIAALNHVISTNGEVDIAEAIYKSTLFGPTDAGSKQSQFHRDTDVETDAQEFREQAVREYDAVAGLLRANGVDPTQMKDFEQGCQMLAFTLAKAHSSTFKYEMR
ncbi:DUF4157 domain-containing protein [Streptomyces graminilatus]|uniref:eCIS core domain-containing protein n=1 Tax=Streptomyces graminilatus TaxID=1464070 RepID=UPI0006E375D8|nr:DUF4157 domain-containing protein [Streptomyces graminilatus]